MRFKEFITEGQKFDLEKFKSDCAFYLDRLKGTNGDRLLYRGTHDFPKDFKIETWKSREGPRDSSLEMHDGINDFLNGKFGIKARDWMFCSGHIGDAALYSPGHKSYTIIFPIGKFEWLSALNDDAHDMTEFYNRCKGALAINAATKEKSYDERNKLAIDMMKHKMESWTWYHNQDIVGSIKGANEIMFKCDKFYAFYSYGDTWNSKEMQDFIHSI
jgi:hypothetical protein